MIIVFTGWGTGSNSDHLYQVHLEWVEQVVCQEILGSAFVPEDMVCAGPINGGRSTCHVSKDIYFVKLPALKIIYLLD